MFNRHVTHLVPRYVQGKLRPLQRARVVNHVRSCDRCRAALAREERLVADLRRDMARFGQPRAEQLARVWGEVWRDVQPRPAARRGFHLSATAWLSGLSVTLVMLMVLIVTLPLLAQGEARVEAAPFQARPVSTASPTPGATDTLEARPGDRVALDSAWQGSAVRDPVSTVAYVPRVGASPVPMPGATVSPDAGSP